MFRFDDNALAFGAVLQSSTIADANKHSESNAPGAAASDGSFILEANEVRQAFGAVVALDAISLAARAGEFVTLLGPSGSGKTTLLQIIAGLQEPTSVSDLHIAGKDVRGVPAHRRNVSTVFQHYALFPHMSVGENVEYGLRVRGAPRAQRREKALKLLELVRLSHTYDRRIHQLSGGERQRLALARALAPEPAILLLDEPLGALDEKLRLDMQVELKDLQRRLSMTFIYVTHSQEEALTMSDRIVLMARGRIVQEGSAPELFERPNSRFAAIFMGVENVVDGVVERAAGDAAWIRVKDLLFEGRWTGAGAPQVGYAACMAVRAEKIRVALADRTDTTAVNSVPCTGGRTVYKGKYFDRILDSPIGPIVCRVWDTGPDGDWPAYLEWRVDDCLIAPNG
jgi:ABC-type Fe3+/spermidine/putrescine transport system ATPase subunit